MIRRLPRLRRVLLIVLGVLVALVAVLGLSATLAARGSLARLDGERPVDGLAGPVTVTRDSLGVPDIVAASRADAAFALGWLHGQDRFFQMDLQRRLAAGELAALLGPALRDNDRRNRVHRFRARAAAAVAGLDGPDSALLDAYAAGVNAGLEDLRVRPWEYLVLRQRPRPWRPEDTVLVIDAMFLDLGAENASTEEAWATVRDVLPAPLAALLLPRANRWEAPLEDGPPETEPLPDSTQVDVRDWNYGGRTWASYLPTARQDSSGSNCWAVAGRLTAHGDALLANDMHLGLALPNIWYRARMSWPEGDGRRTVVGVTLPGAPALVVGSNGDVAWGFTNSYADQIDLVVLETDSLDADRYRTPDGWRTVTRDTQLIAVAGGAVDTLVVRETIWGPEWGADVDGRPYALRWTAHDPGAVNLHLMAFETARTVDAMVAAAPTVGIPPQNLICADRDGRIAWTVAGRLPRRVGWDGRLPVSWADGTCRWQGWLDPADYPRVVDPPEGRLWTANNRVAAGRDLDLLGDGGYALGARARQIRDDLRALDHPDEHDMLAVQLDDRAVFMGEWRDLVLPVLESRAAELDSLQTLFLVTVRDHWDGQAAVSSVSYRLVRDFAWQCEDAVYGVLTGPVRGRVKSFRTGWLPHTIAVTWRLLTERPPHLVPVGCADWDDVMLQAVDRVMANATWEGRALADYTWGARNVVRIAHPFADLDHRLDRWLAAPIRSLPGESFMPRVQGNSSGASERLVVSPGHEDRGIFHMPGGQGGHPLSPYFLAGHDAWAQGRPRPLLPGPPEHRLVLRPR